MKNSTLIIIPDYMNEFNDYITMYSQYFSVNEVNIFDWSRLFEYKDKILFEIIYRKIKEFINCKKSNINKNIFIGSGIGATILYLLSFELDIKNLILVSPYFSTTYINPYTSDIPCYKSNYKSFLLRINKEYFSNTNIIKHSNSQLFNHKYMNYKNNVEFYDKCTDIFSSYEFLNNLHKFEKTHKFLNNTNYLFLLGIYDKNVNFKKTVSFIKKYNFEYISFDYSAHHLEFEETSKFIGILNQYISLLKK